MSLSKNPTHTICIEAVLAHLEHGAPIEQTIRACTDIRKFLVVRAVAGGAVDADGYLGKAVRFYYAKGPKGSLSYAKRKAKVSKSDGAKQLMELPKEFPNDVDYMRYLAECHAILNEIGWLQRRLF
jgi:hypothetical protein